MGDTSTGAVSDLDLRRGGARLPDRHDLHERRLQLAALCDRRRVDGEELLRQLEEAPDDVATHLVYADWLLSRGDPRGELISLQHAGLTDAAALLLRHHERHFYGPVAARPHTLSEVDWRLGFIRSCRFALERAADRRPRTEERDARELGRLLDAFLVHPSTRLLHTLSLGPMTTPYNDYSEALQVLASHSRPTLRVLAIADDGRQLLQSTLGDPAPLAMIGASLYKLEVKARDEDRASLDARWFPTLRELRLSVKSLSVEGVVTLLAMPWHDVHTLRLEGDFRADESEWTALFSGRAFPTLRHFGWHSYRGLGFFAMIATSALLAELETLDLSYSMLDDERAAVLIANRERFVHLKRLQLSTMMHDEALRFELYGLCPDVYLDGIPSR